MKKNFILWVGFIVLFFGPIVVMAAEQGFINEPETGYVNQPSNTVKLSNPLGDIESFPELIKAILDAAIIIGFPIAVLFIVFAGFRFVC